MQKMKKTFLIATVQDRISGLILLLQSLKDFDGWDFVIIAQSYSDDDKAYVEGFAERIGISVNMVYVENGIGPGRAKRLGLTMFKSDIWVSLDDDMEAVPGITNYETMITVLMDRKDIGFLSANWAKTDELVRKKKLEDKLVKQDIVYTGGGMMFRQDVADALIANMPDEPWLFDNVAWSLAAYVAGYENYRYLGSAAIHKVCTKGGRKAWVRLGKRVLPDQTLIRVRKASNDKAELAVDNCYCICSASDLTDKAKAVHKKNREAMLNASKTEANERAY